MTAANEDDGSLRPTRSMRAVRKHDERVATIALRLTIGALVAVGVAELVLAAYLLQLCR